ncbi:MAG: hypothetical protein CMB78_06325 [Euryarchaeota archaeon]|nr:hypothetical protein [Euryarchaeota archaeon]
MKVVYLQQKWTVGGPWKSFNYDDLSTKEILSTQLSKAGHPFEMILLFESDVRLIDCYVPPMWLQQQMSRKEYRQAIQKYTSGVVEAYDFFSDDDEVWNNCDVVITEDPFLVNIEHLKQKWPDKLYCTFRSEHGDSMQWENHYDLLFNHALGYGEVKVLGDYKHNLTEVMDSKNIENKYKVGSVVYYPYPRDPKKIREAFDCINKTHINFDYRTVTFLSTGQDDVAYEDEYFEKIETIADSLKMKCVEVSEKVKEPFMVTYPMESDSLEYYENLAKSKYYVSVSNRLGQGLVDAVSCNAISIGHINSPNHKVLCHPECLIKEDLTKIDEKYITKMIMLIEKSEKLQKDILEYQNKQLIKHFVDYPKNMIKQLLKLKRGEKV